VSVKARPSPATAPRLIRRYDNRKLYDPAAGRYVTLEDLARMVGGGEEVQVVDQRRGEDLTAVVLAQVILEGVKERTARIPGQVLARLIRLGFDPAGKGVPRPDPTHDAARTRQEAERIVSGLLNRGRLTLDEAVALRQEIAGAVHRLVADAQHGLESRLHRMLATSAEDGVSPSLAALRERLLSLETQLEPRPAPKARGARPDKKPKQRR
jgi:polyhydroxyalkanoate synthesis repressor PhaR